MKWVQSSAKEIGRGKLTRALRNLRTVETQWFSLAHIRKFAREGVVRIQYFSLRNFVHARSNPVALMLVNLILVNWKEASTPERIYVYSSTYTQTEAMTKVSVAASVFVLREKTVAGRARSMIKIPKSGKRIEANKAREYSITRNVNNEPVVYVFSEGK